MVMVRFVRVCLAALSMCHPQVIVSRPLIRHDGGNILKYQDNRAGLQRLSLNPMECGISTLYVGKTRPYAPRYAWSMTYVFFHHCVAQRRSWHIHPGRTCNVNRTYGRESAITPHLLYRLVTKEVTRALPDIRDGQK